MTTSPARTYTVDPELQPFFNGFPENTPQPKDIPALRALFESMDLYKNVPLVAPPGCTQLPSHTVTSADGAVIEVLHLTPTTPNNTTAERPARALVFCFGGGFITGNATTNIGAAGGVALDTQSQVFVPNYRLAPEHPHPAAVEDVHATLRWVQSHAAELGVDAARVVLLGISAGGGAAAGAALLARDRASESPAPAGLALRYPMLDDRTLPEDAAQQRFHTWTSVANELAWTAYTGGRSRAQRTRDNMPLYAAPGRAEPHELRGLPPTFVDVGELDLFRAEDVRFAAALADAGVEVEFHHYPGIPHAVEVIAPQITKVVNMNKNLFRFVTRF